MLLSFSHEAMRQYLEAGCDQARGLGVGGARVKRTTIRAMGPRYGRLLDDKAVKQGDVPLHLWWKSRRPERQFIGKATLLGIERIEIQRVKLDAEPDAEPWVVVQGAPSLFELFGSAPGANWINASMSLSGDAADRLLGYDAFGEMGVPAIAEQDGFQTARDFADYFVPGLGDRFEGVALKW